MSFDAQQLYDLMPAIYRIRDAEQGEPLKALLSVIAEQAAILEENLEQLYDDQFIETCAEWVVPYIGDLVGYRALHGVVAKVSSPRAELAHTIAYRRRKGTAAMLEQFARDVTGWNARVVEFFQLLATTQYMNHIRSDNRYSPDLRSWEVLEKLHTPFDRVAHTLEVRRITPCQGRYNIANIGIFLWRLNAYSMTDSPAFKVDDHRYLFSPLGHNMRLFARPETEDEITHIAEPIHVPNPISRRVLGHYLDLYYGAGKSLLLNVDGAEVGANEIVICNLSDGGSGAWAHMPQDKYAIDPVLGRIALPANRPVPASVPPVRVTCHYAFSAEMGGGEYERAASLDPLLQPVQQVTMPSVAPPPPVIQNGLNAVINGGLVQIGDSGRYVETLSITVKPGKRLEWRAADEDRPTVVLEGDLEITGGADAEVTLNGLLMTGGTIRVPASEGNQLRRLRIRHCTLVPGISLTNSGTPGRPEQPSLIVDLQNVTVEIDHCIVGGLRVVEGARVQITDSIVDANHETEVAYAATDGESAGGKLEVTDSTIIGKVHTVFMELASNTLFVADLTTPDPWNVPVRSEREQAGCVRFSYLPENSRVPRPYRCQPDLAVEKAIEAALKKNPALTSAEKNGIAKGIRAWLKPTFTDRRYGQPAYCQLGPSCPMAIRTGADDEGEMGAFHKLYHPQRETDLRVRLGEYLRFGLEVGIFYVT
jgi:hypothetical protein